MGLKADKQLWVLVGGNGAGKTTFYRQFIEPLGLPFINADLIAKELFPDNPEANSYTAARAAEQLRYRILSLGKSFCFETVFSHPSKIDFIADAKALGYEIILVFLHLQHSDLNKARVLQRVEEGGHNVPQEKIEQRIPRLLDNLSIAMPLCDEVYILDNSSAQNPFRQVARITQGRVSLSEDCPDWVQTLVG